MNNGHFTKTSFGGKRALQTQPNPTLSLVTLTWLRHLQQFFYEDITQKNGDRCEMGKYSPTKNNPTCASTPLTNILFSRYDQQLFLTPITCLEDFKPIEDSKRGVCTPLEEWAMRILKPTNTIQLQKLHDISTETETRWENADKDHPEFCIKDINAPTTNIDEPMENCRKSLNSSVINMKGYSTNTLISIINACFSNQYAQANSKKNAPNISQNENSQI